MRIAFVIPNLGPGGAERVASLLCNDWVGQGHEVVLLTFEEEGAEPFFPLDPRITLRPLAAAELSRGLAEMVSKNFARISRLRASLRELRPDAVVAFMTEKLELSERDKVLEIGTGSGYQAAVLSHLCRRVYTVERWRELQKAADRRFVKLGITNVTTIIGDGRIGWPPQAPFDRIIVTAAAKHAPPALLDQLKVGGRMIIPLGETRDTQQLVQIDKTEAGLREVELLPVRFVPLVHGRAGVAARQKGPRPKPEDA